jgi:hypothetical protein
VHDISFQQCCGSVDPDPVGSASFWRIRIYFNHAVCKAKLYGTKFQMLSKILKIMRSMTLKREITGTVVNKSKTKNADFPTCVNFWVGSGSGSASRWIGSDPGPASKRCQSTTVVLTVLQIR